jgi:hypothetical protein
VMFMEALLIIRYPEVLRYHGVWCEQMRRPCFST